MAGWLSKTASWLTGGMLGDNGDSDNIIAQEQANVNATNSANQAIAQKQMDFQREMSNTAWQRGVADMSKAGINPILAATAGAASTPSGSAIASQKADITGSYNAATNRFNSKTQRMSALAGSALSVAKLALAA